MTPAINSLKKLKASFETLQYSHDSNAKSYGLEAAEKLKLPIARVFKTLVVQLANDQLVTALVPVASKLDMKALAKHLKVKGAKMATPDVVKNSTGYVLGGVSPFGQKKAKVTVIDSSAAELDEIYVSAGRRGLELKVSPQIFKQALKAEFYDIATDS
jgi:Cys-tRNA(Pro)/Cys-tRNA(Cys) deacylase